MRHVRRHRRQMFMRLAIDPDRAGGDENDDCPQEARSAAAHTTAWRRQPVEALPLVEGPLGVNGVA